MLNGGLPSKVIDFLPTVEERKWLVDTLIAVRKHYGVDAFLTSIVVEPDRAYFPDTWRGGQASIERLARRVLHFAGISDIPVELQIVAAENRRDERAKRSPWGNFASWVEEDRTGEIRICVHEIMVKDPVVLVAVLARSVAQIYIRVAEKRQGLGELKSDLSRKPFRFSNPSDPRIDVVAAYLGFSILIIQGQNRMRQQNRASSPGEFSAFVSARLPNVAIAYLLSIQLKVRGLESKAIARVAKRLAPNDAACLNSAAKNLEQEIVEIRHGLKLPSAENWPETRRLSEYLADLGENPRLSDEHDHLVRSEDSEDHERPLVQENRGIVGANAGKPVFRVRRRMLGRMMKVALGLGFLVGMLSRGFPGIELDTSTYAIGFAALILFAGLLGLVFNESRCSDPKCEQKLLPDMRECPRCGGQIVGEIRHPNQRLAAEENYLQAERPKEIVDE